MYHDKTSETVWGRRYSNIFNHNWFLDVSGYLSILCLLNAAWTICLKIKLNDISDIITDECVLRYGDEIPALSSTDALMDTTCNTATKNDFNNKRCLQHKSWSMPDLKQQRILHFKNTLNSENVLPSNGPQSVGYPSNILSIPPLKTVPDTYLGSVNSKIKVSSH